MKQFTLKVLFSISIGVLFLPNMAVGAVTSLESEDIQKLIVKGKKGIGQYAVSAAGDVNGDGYDDAFVNQTITKNIDEEKSNLYIVYGSGSAMTTTQPLSQTTKILSTKSDVRKNEIAHIISAVGDVNGDGYDDVMINKIKMNKNGDVVNKLYLVYGSASGISENPLQDAVEFVNDAADKSLALQYSVSSAGDMNNDGYDDMIIGVPHYSPQRGTAYLVYGKGEQYSGSQLLSGVAAAQFTGESKQDFELFSVSGAGDVNNDGYDDVLLSIFGEKKRAVYLIYGKSEKYSGSESLSSVGKFTLKKGDFVFLSVSGAGDVNGDGYDDMIIGVPHYSPQRGTAYLVYGKGEQYSGSQSLSSVAAQFTGESKQDFAGFSVSGAGDVNNDGYDDMIIGAMGDDVGGVEKGAVYLVYGKGEQYSGSQSLGSTVKFIGESPVAGSLGVSVSGVGDMNNDGYDDVITSYDFAKNVAAYIIYGKSEKYKSAHLLKKTQHYLQVIVDGVIVDTKKMGKKKIAKKDITVVEKKLYKNKDYTTVFVLRSGKKKATLSVFELTEENQLTKKAKKSIRLSGKRTPLDLTINTKKKRVSISIGKWQNKKVEALYKVTKKGKLKEIQ